MSRKVHALNRSALEKTSCGPARLSRLLTEARQAMSWLREGAAVPQQQVVRDFAKSRAKALLTVVWSRELPSVPSSVRVYRDALGHWYASFVVTAGVEPLPSTGLAIGIDWGVRETATTTSDAHDLPHAQHGRNAAPKLARYQRMMARRKTPRNRPDTAGYHKARTAAAKVHKKAARQRQDSARKWAKRVVRDHDTLAVEDFRPQFPARSTMARKAADAAITAAKTALSEMARKHGRTVHLIHPAHTTRECAQCGARAKHALPLAERTFTCTACGLASPRDKNSARVMLVRAGLDPAGADLVRPATC